LLQGGAGKTCITAAVVRTNMAVRKQFCDGIAWIGMNQQPKIRRLQRKLHFQLFQEHFPTEGSEQEQHMHLESALKKKTVLIILDDCT
jgi:hypothetical protein